MHNHSRVADLSSDREIFNQELEEKNRAHYVASLSAQWFFL